MNCYYLCLVDGAAESVVVAEDVESVPEAEAKPKKKKKSKPVVVQEFEPEEEEQPEEVCLKYSDVISSSEKSNP